MNMVFINEYNMQSQHAICESAGLLNFQTYRRSYDKS